VSAARAKARGSACVEIAGRTSRGLGLLRALGADAAFGLCPGPVRLDEAMARGGWLLADAADDAVRRFLAGRRRYAKEE
jgi:glycerate kinase